ncbi:YgjV family protein [Shewanella sp.]|uniref:YgjV family protein n=1 Tax=Shewanella sp. TaxID=50422 RepID=UPI003A976C06
MDTLNTVEIVGYAASLMVAISLMMKDIIWLRWINFVGCVLFVAYGISINAMPVAVMNGFVAIVNIVHLVRLYRNKSSEPVTA